MPQAPPSFLLYKSALVLAVFCLFSSGCDSKAQHPEKASKTQEAETNTAAGKTALTVPVVPNPSFEQGTDGKPLGWSGVGKVAWTKGDAADGSQYVSVSSGAAPEKEGGIDEEIGWLSDPVSLVPGVAYELRFRCRYRPENLFATANAFVGPECARLLIRLEGSQLVSPWRSHSVRFVAPAAPPTNGQRVALAENDPTAAARREKIEAWNREADPEWAKYQPLRWALSRQVLDGSMDGWVKLQSHPIFGIRAKFEALT